MQKLVDQPLPWSMTWLCPTTMEWLVGHWHHNQHQGGIHAPTKRYQPIVYQVVCQLPKRWQSWIYCQKWHGIAERCIPCQHLILKAREKSAGQRIQGRDLDKLKDSTWVFFSILKRRVKHIHRASKNMGTTNFVVNMSHPWPKFVRQDAGGWVWQTIKNPNSVVNCLRPISLSSFCRPMSGQVEHVGTRPCATVFMFHSAIPFWCLAPTPLIENFCCCHSQCSWKSAAAKNPVIQMVRLDPEPCIPCHWFEALGTLYYFASIVGILWKIEYLATCVVHKQAAAHVFNAFLTKCMGEATGNRWEIVVSGNTITRSKIIRLEHLVFWQRTRHHVWWRLCGSLSKEACCTFHIWNITGRSTTLCDKKGSWVKCGIGITSVGKPFPIPHQCLYPICWDMQQSLAPQENFLLRWRKVGILLMEGRLDFNNFIVCLYGLTKSIRPKTIPSTRWKGKGDHGKVSARALVSRKNQSIVQVQADDHSLIIEKSMTA